MNTNHLSGSNPWLGPNENRAERDPSNSGRDGSAEVVAKSRMGIVSEAARRLFNSVERNGLKLKVDPSMTIQTRYPQIGVGAPSSAVSRYQEPGMQQGNTNPGVLGDEVSDPSANAEYLDRLASNREKIQQYDALQPDRVKEARIATDQARKDRSPANTDHANNPGLDANRFELAA